MEEINTMSLKKKLVLGVLLVIGLGIVGSINYYLPNSTLAGVGGWFNPLHITYVNKN
ncbi:hypothetical protein Desaci_1454 [Desulfosporosinus acidiphilus SJ4]|uniref:Uncharacterized protein n=1 Tax=Desulfosporosinus acidiphilus (strain DSM 22704 / JCM 16185 / SJ4) TaxID=646529 RepID=I4D3U7_DESAJ|nr:hypothetical protein [Desulfosporosinus acidiphilus]AFM40471.1 hypothetical protein Desaci_1454 [Desulfosporosinus acidiphilus SJ4]